MPKILQFLLAIAFSTPIYSQYISRSEARESLYIEAYRNKEYIGSATGFIIRSAKQNYLVTCYHVITNRDPKTKKWTNVKKPLAPNRIAIFHNAKEKYRYFVKFENLFAGNGKSKKKRWLENFVRLKNKRTLTDIAELPLTDTTDIKILAVDYKNAISYEYKRNLLVQGFPMTLKAEHASEPPATGLINIDIMQDTTSTPLVWLSDTTLIEMSGSPVFFSGNTISASAVSDTAVFSSGLFVGMYSKMRDKASGLIAAKFIGDNFERLINPLPANKHGRLGKRKNK